MAQYGRLDKYGNRIRNENELTQIEQALERYLSTKDDDLIRDYLDIWEDLKRLLKRYKHNVNINQNVCGYYMGFTTSIITER